MKKTIRILSFILALVIMLGMFISFTGCTSSKLIGTWYFEGEEDGMRLVFQRGGKGYAKDTDWDGEVYIEHFKWKLSGKKLTITFTDGESSNKEVIKIVSLTNRRIEIAYQYDGKFDYEDTDVLIKERR